jgi:glycerophosphoryl diester phosphodiesterase
MAAVTIVIAHRGDPVAARENTLPAFEAAVAGGADMVELDLRQTRDGEIVVLHDATLSRLWADPRRVAELDLSALRNLGAGRTRIPTLDDVLAHIAIPLMVDFGGRDVAENAFDKVRAAGAVDRVLFVSGSIGALRALRALAPEARLGLTWTVPELPAPALLDELGPEYWNPAFALVTPQRVADLHRRGLKVSTWTVDTTRPMARVLDAGVDAVVTNRLRELRRYLARRARRAGG